MINQILPSILTGQYAETPKGDIISRVLSAESSGVSTRYHLPLLLELPSSASPRSFLRAPDYVPESNPNTSFLSGKICFFGKILGKFCSFLLLHRHRRRTLCSNQRTTPASISSNHFSFCHRRHLRRTMCRNRTPTPASPPASSVLFFFADIGAGLCARIEAQRLLPLQ
ncbi:hypothetical protein KSP40_PGU012384 [Platanthera guangdongensis]|uniref:Uncharacterized protein n=1 Tax=Platanthera guangdongensis TaxID=2320717 RepID=A0ABR2LC52_9ASPA